MAGSAWLAVARRGLGSVVPPLVALPLLAGAAAAQGTTQGTTQGTPRANTQGTTRLGTYFDPLNLNWADGRWYVTAYAGLMAEKKLSSVVLFNADLQDDVLVAVGLGREFAAYGDVLRFEWELNVAVHEDPFGTIGDFRAMVGARWTWFPWNRWLPTTFAVMTGPSYLTGDSEYETRKGKTSRFANGMAFEFTFALPQREDIRGVFRIHHRSPVFGTTGEASPSDAVTFGFQYRF